MKSNRINRAHALIENRALAAVENARKRVSMAKDFKARAVDAFRLANDELAEAEYQLRLVTADLDKAASRKGA